MSGGKPDAELAITPALATRLLAEQHPDLAHLLLSEFASGWDNVLYRLGDEYLLRLPRREIGAALIRHEQTWLGKLAPKLTLPAPSPIRVGQTQADYPWHWSITPWFAGTTADQAYPAESEATRWAEFLISLHQPAPANAPINEVRGVPLAHRQAALTPRIERLRQQDLVSSQALKIWEQALAASEAGESLWLHGDLHAQNVVTRDGRLAAVIDWGDITSGDVATDLASIWALFDDPRARELILNTYGGDQACVSRAKGWAVMFGIILLDSGLINSPRHAAMGQDMLRRLLEDD